MEFIKNWQKKKEKNELLGKSYLRASMSMISAHGQVVFVCWAGEVITVDSCSKMRGLGKPHWHTGMESQPLRTAHARTNLNAENTLCSPLPEPVSKYQLSRPCGHFILSKSSHYYFITLIEDTRFCWGGVEKFEPCVYAVSEGPQFPSTPCFYTANSDQ